MKNMSDFKRLQTRIALKYDTYANWTDEAKGANLVLLKGEIGFCELPSGNAEATTAPTVLFKVGDGEKPFKSLKWASALAADVYDWAKAERAEFDATSGKIVFKDANGNKVATAKEIDLSSLATNAALESAVKTINKALEGQTEDISDNSDRITEIEAALGLGNTGDGNSVSKRLGALEDAVEVINGDAETEGSIAKAEADAKDYADGQIEAAVEDVTDAYESYTTNAVKAATNTIAEKDAAQDELIQANTAAIAKEAENRAAADALINEKFGAEYSKNSTVKDAIDAAKSGAEATAAGALTVAKTEIKGVTDKLAEDLAKETKAREDADKELTEDVAKIKAFFESADADGEDTESGKTLYDALDTLKEIQDFINGEATAADELLESVGNNTSAITELQKTVDGTEAGEYKDGLVAKVAANVEAISGVANKTTNLEKVVKGYETEGSIKTAIEGAASLAQTGVDNAATAQAAAEAAQGDATNALNAIGNAESGIIADVAAVTATANQNKEDIAAEKERVNALVELTKADGTIQTAIKAAKDQADKGVADAKAADDKAVAAQNAADAAQTDATNALTAIGDTNSGLVKDINKNKEDIAAIQADYLKVADWFIIDCGSAVLREGEPTV
jgi:hypothetical protein